MPISPSLDFHILFRGADHTRRGSAVQNDDTASRYPPGMIELTEAGFRRMGQAQSAGLDTVIEVDRRCLLRFPASPAR
jgi:hypothetical protein